MYHGEKLSVFVSAVVMLMLISPRSGFGLLNSKAAAFHVWVIGVSPNELSRTTSGDVAFWVQTTGIWAVPMVQSLKTVPFPEPKNNAPEAVVKGDTVDEKSEGVMPPRTVASMIGNVSSAWKRMDEELGGTG